MERTKEEIKACLDPHTRNEEEVANTNVQTKKNVGSRVRKKQTRSKKTRVKTKRKKKENGKNKTYIFSKFKPTILIFPLYFNLAADNDSLITGILQIRSDHDMCRVEAKYLMTRWFLGTVVIIKN